MILNDEHQFLLLTFGTILIPGSAKMPTFSAVQNISGFLEKGAEALGLSSATIHESIAKTAKISTLAEAKAFAEVDRESFDRIALLVSGAYYMAKEVMLALNYPLERQHPAGVSDFADEYMTGILDPVIDNRRGGLWIQEREI